MSGFVKAIAGAKSEREAYERALSWFAEAQDRMWAQFRSAAASEPQREPHHD